MKYIFTSIILIFFLSSCEKDSKKGAWSDSDKNKMKEAVIMSGKANGLQLSYKQWDYIFECFIKAVEPNFESFATFEKEPDNIKMEFLLKCAMGEKNNWGGFAKQSYIEGCERRLRLGSFPEDVIEEACQCELKAVEKLYSPSKLNVDEEIENIKKIQKACLYPMLDKKGYKYEIK
ncbi:MAG: hypothetical protein MUC49_11115 [Raineya sp.]|jgi:hypothetical protein|nr:hypothetical protein [Raineya sp.]